MSFSSCRHVLFECFLSSIFVQKNSFWTIFELSITIKIFELDLWIFWLPGEPDVQFCFKKQLEFAAKKCENLIGNLLGFQLWSRTDTRTWNFLGGRGTGPLKNRNFLQIQKKKFPDKKNLAAIDELGDVVADIVWQMKSMIKWVFSMTVLNSPYCSY